MKILNDETKHYREARILIDRLELERLIGMKAQELAGFHGVYKVVIEEDTFGSPPYKVGYKAFITLTEDLSI